jgi:integrase/recombinase XerD
MAQAKTLPREILEVVINERLPKVSHRLTYDRVLLSLSFKGGLRACEMAGLKMTDVLDVMGNVIPVGESWRVPPGIAKKGHGRTIPMHAELHANISALRAELPPQFNAPNAPVLAAPYEQKPTHNTPDALRKYVAQLYARMKLVGCTSHSGRRTFTTELIRAANAHNCSIRDVQLAVGHLHLSTTEKYVEPSLGVHSLVNSL